MSGEKRLITYGAYSNNEPQTKKVRRDQNNSDSKAIPTTNIDDFQMQQLVLILTQCELLKDLILEIVTLIAEYGFGHTRLCECREEQILILPSQIKQFDSYPCYKCDNGFVTNKQCDVCIDSREPKVGWYYPACYRCSDSMIHDSYPNQFPYYLCPKCRFNCKACYRNCCIHRHLESVCSRCNASYCKQCKMKTFLCINCNQEVCEWEGILIEKYGGSKFEQWIRVGDLYKVCRLCFSHAIANIYPSETCYKSCTKLQRILHEHLKDNLNSLITEIIAIFANECQGKNCLQCKKEWNKDF